MKLRWTCDVYTVAASWSRKSWMTSNRWTGSSCWVEQSFARRSTAARAKGKRWLYILTCAAVVVLGFALGTLGIVDYYGAGVLTVFAFYFFRERKWWCLLGQLAALYWLNVVVLGGQMYPVTLFGREIELCEQGLALLALVPIWLYRGRQGHHSKAFQYACYAFYPAHMLVLALLTMIQ